MPHLCCLVFPCLLFPLCSPFACTDHPHLRVNPLLLAQLHCRSKAGQRNGSTSTRRRLHSHPWCTALLVAAPAAAPKPQPLFAEPSISIYRSSLPLPIVCSLAAYLQFDVPSHLLPLLHPRHVLRVHV